MSVIKQIKVKDINTKSISHSKFEKYKKESTRLTCLILYKYPKIDKPSFFCVKITKEIELKCGGIPPRHEKFAPTDDKRLSLRIVLIKNDPGCEEIRTAIKTYHDFAVANQQEIMGSQSKLYCIVNPIKTPEITEAVPDKDSKKQKESIFDKYKLEDYVKMRFISDRYSPDPLCPIIKTPIFVRNLATNKVKLLNEPTINDIEKIFKLKSKYKIVFSFFKLSGALGKVQHATDRFADIIMNIEQLVITPGEKSQDARDEFKKLAYSDDEIESGSDSKGHSNSVIRSDSDKNKTKSSCIDVSDDSDVEKNMSNLKLNDNSDDKVEDQDNVDSDKHDDSDKSDKSNDSSDDDSKNVKKTTNKPVAKNKSKGKIVREKKHDQKKNKKVKKDDSDSNVSDN